MKNKLLTIITTSIIIISNQFSFADNCCVTDPCCPSNWYIAGSGSVAWHNDSRFDLGSIINSNVVLDYKPGWGATASVGYIINTCSPQTLRIELEFLYRRNKMNNLTLNNPIISASESINGDHQDLAFMSNLLFDIPLPCNFDFYLGGGIGATSSRFSVSDNGDTDHDHVNETLFAWQILTGFAYWFCPNVALTADYRLFGTTKHEKTKFFLGPLTYLPSNKIPLTQSIDIGLRFRL